MRANEAGVTLELLGPADLEAEVDGRKIQRALFCLRDERRAGLAAGTDRDHRRCGAAGTPTGSQVQIRVVDRGEGMSRDVLERLKRPPFTTRPDGAGLGVAVARTLVEQHGGRLLYESAPGQGTTATIELPQRQPAREPAPAAGARRAARRDRGARLRCRDG